MISRDAKPIRNDGPLKPIEMSPRHKMAAAPVKESWEIVLDEASAHGNRAEADRIWELIVSSSEGRGIGHVEEA